MFIPIFVEYLERNDRDGGWKALSVIANFILVVGTIGIALLMIFARPLTSLVAPGFAEPAEVATLVRLSRDGMRIDALLYAGNNLRKAQEIFVTTVRHRSDIRLTIRQRTRVLQQWPPQD